MFLFIYFVYEDKLWEFILSFHDVGPGVKLQSSDLVASGCACWVILIALT